MKKKKNIAVQVLAILALIGIIISIIGTALLVIFGNNESSYSDTISAEQLQDIVNSTQVEVSSGSGTITTNLSGASTGTTTQ